MRLAGCQDSLAQTTPLKAHSSGSRAPPAPLRNGEWSCRWNDPEVEFRHISSQGARPGRGADGPAVAVNAARRAAALTNLTRNKFRSARDRSERVLADVEMFWAAGQGVASMACRAVSSIILRGRPRYGLWASGALSQLARPDTPLITPLMTGAAGRERPRR